MLSGTSVSVRSTSPHLLTVE